MHIRYAHNMASGITRQCWNEDNYKVIKVFKFEDDIPLLEVHKELKDKFKSLRNFEVEVCVAAKRRCAYITFASHDEAVECFKQTRSFTLGGMPAHAAPLITKLSSKPPAHLTYRREVPRVKKSGNTSFISKNLRPREASSDGHQFTCSYPNIRNAPSFVSTKMKPQNKAFQQPSRILYIGGLSADISRAELYRIFSPFGYIEDIELKTKDSGKKYAFIYYFNIMMAIRALHQMTGMKVGHQIPSKLWYGRSSLSKCLWIGEIEQSINDVQLKTEFGKFGEIVRFERRWGKSFAYVVYENTRDADNAFDHLQNLNLGENGNCLLVDFVPLKHIESKLNYKMEMCDGSEKQNDNFHLNQLHRSTKVMNEKVPSLFDTSGKPNIPINSTLLRESLSNRVRKPDDPGTLLRKLRSEYKELLNQQCYNENDSGVVQETLSDVALPDYKYLNVDTTVANTAATKRKGVCIANTSCSITEKWKDKRDALNEGYSMWNGEFKRRRIGEEPGKLSGVESFLIDFDNDDKNLFQSQSENYCYSSYGYADEVRITDTAQTSSLMPLRRPIGPRTPPGDPDQFELAEPVLTVSSQRAFPITEYPTWLSSAFAVGISNMSVIPADNLIYISPAKSYSSLSSLSSAFDARYSEMPFLSNKVLMTVSCQVPHSDVKQEPIQQIDGRNYEGVKYDALSKNEEISIANSIHFLRRFPIVWSGALVLKNHAFMSDFHLVSGSVLLLNGMLRDPGVSDCPVLKMTRCMLFADQEKLNELERRISSCGRSRCSVLLAVPSASEVVDLNNIIEQQTLSYLGTYLRGKGCAAVVFLHSSQYAGVLHIFPPCKFATNFLHREAPELSSTYLRNDSLLVIGMHECDP